jgi:hypothetical protein
MQVWRRVRGLLGTALTWGAVGALIGASMFLVRYRPWSVSATHWDRALALMGGFIGGGALWGSVCGLAFGVAVVAHARRSSLHRMTARRFTVWGAVAGAAFPGLIYTPAVLMTGAFDAIPFFSMLTGASAIAGALCARAIFALACRAPGLRTGPGELAVSLPENIAEASFAIPERERA